VTDALNPFPAERPEPGRRRNRRRRRRKQPQSSPTALPTAAAGLIPPVIKVEIQNLDQMSRVWNDDGADDGRLAAARHELEEREARLDAAEADLRARLRHVEELEGRIGPDAALLESRESLERRERRTSELEQQLRERSRAVDERENDLEARKAVVEADLELREEEVERREDLLAIREERLADRQRELGVYVSQIQGNIESHLAAG
jgi:DNA repair exonuclease SbcCD ATPase subunit